MPELLMSPGTGERALRFVGDRITFRLRCADGAPLPEGWRGLLRTTIGRGTVLRHEIIHARTGHLKLKRAAWRDIPMRVQEGEWVLDLPLVEVGYFRAKCYALDAHGRQHWPAGNDVGVSIHPSRYRTANTIYCAFVRMFGETMSLASTRDEKLEHLLTALDGDGYTVIPPSGKFRDLIRALPHIVDTLGCRILHLLPVNPTPTVLAKFGRFGSPYALQDLLAVDPALVEFDQRTTGLDQFCELACATHARGARLFLDVVINHTGWGSSLQENHPEWFVRDDQGNFVCPGAWGVTWEDLTELNHHNPPLWEYLGDVFLEWCRRGVDGFRCDAGYKIPMPAWRYITARVLDEFPETIFLLEGLGGPWDATESLLTDGGMQWAYSELFQNQGGRDVAWYLDHSLRQSSRLGLYVNYSETHDNDRLAARGRAWSLHRNRLHALSCGSGAFGFTCGVEWLAAEKLQVHQSRGLAWGSADNIVTELSELNRLVSDHPCFFDGATVTRLSPPDSEVLALGRVSGTGEDRLLVLINNDVTRPHTLVLEDAQYREYGRPAIDLLGAPPPPVRTAGPGRIEFTLPPGAAVCLATTPQPAGLAGEEYRRRRAQAAWAIAMITRRFHARDIGAYDWRRLAELVARNHRTFLAALGHLNSGTLRHDLEAALSEAMKHARYPQVAVWKLEDRTRILPVPAEHWLAVEDAFPFRVVLRPPGGGRPIHLESTPLRAAVPPGDIPGLHVAAFPPAPAVGSGLLEVQRFAPADPKVAASILFLPAPDAPGPVPPRLAQSVLLTNGIGGMARMQLDLGAIQSKYDCVLGANLHADVPVDRHIFVKRVRMWVNADGFVEPLHQDTLAEFQPGPPAVWRFVASAGDSHAVAIELAADMIEGRNTTVLRFHRPAQPVPVGRDLPEEARVFLIVRVDIEDRNFHHETQRNSGADHHFSTHSRPLKSGIGFEFTPAGDRRLRVFSDAGDYHHEAEWLQHVPHPVEVSRGQVAHGDAYSPGWFSLPLQRGGEASLVLTADATLPGPEDLRALAEQQPIALERAAQAAGLAETDTFGRRLARAIPAFVVKRGTGRTVIAGYPWFLDWGRDSLIAARGLLAAGLTETVRELLVTFGRFADRGTLPNSIHGEDASNRDTSDAPLWFGMVCEDLAAAAGESVYATSLGSGRGTLLDALRAIAAGYRDGTPNGIRLDPASALIWSPSHFTWMDTNHPAGTPREGFPVEIQVLWIRLLRQLAQRDEAARRAEWSQLAERAVRSLLQFFWFEEGGYLADLLAAPRGAPAAQAVPDTALRSNYLFAISLGLLEGERARRAVQAAIEHLVVPGALRSLAPLPVRVPLPVRAADGRLLNDPLRPYQGRYEGDEDTRRKPAYHNGTAWTWTFPVACEALARAWNFEPGAVAAARSLLRSVEGLLDEGCAGQLPEIVDGDAPHTQRGCDAQAWSVTEALRVWKLLGR